jgi:hypothetical protein
LPGDERSVRLLPVGAPATSPAGSVFSGNGVNGVRYQAA